MSKARAEPTSRKKKINFSVMGQKVQFTQPSSALRRVEGCATSPGDDLDFLNMHSTTMGSQLECSSRNLK